MDIMALVNMLNSDDQLSKISGKAGAEKDKVRQLVDLGLPVIMQAMGRNAKSPDGASALLGALKQHQEDDVQRMLENPQAIDTRDGEKILSHLLSSKDQQVKKNLASQTGLGTDQVGSVLAQLAPLLMGAMGQQQKQSGVSASGLSSLITDALGKSAKGGMMDLAEQFLDADDDGSIVDDLGKMLGGMFGKK